MAPCFNIYIRGSIVNFFRKKSVETASIQGTSRQSKIARFFRNEFSKEAWIGQDRPPYLAMLAGTIGIIMIGHSPVMRPFFSRDELVQLRSNYCSSHTLNSGNVMLDRYIYNVWEAADTKMGWIEMSEWKGKDASLAYLNDHLLDSKGIKASEGYVLGQYKIDHLELAKDRLGGNLVCPVFSSFGRGNSPYGFDTYNPDIYKAIKEYLTNPSGALDFVDNCLQPLIKKAYSAVGLGGKEIRLDDYQIVKIASRIISIASIKQDGSILRYGNYGECEGFAPNGTKHMIYNIRLTKNHVLTHEILHAASGVDYRIGIDADDEPGRTASHNFEEAMTALVSGDGSYGEWLLPIVGKIGDLPPKEGKATMDAVMRSWLNLSTQDEYRRVLDFFIGAVAECQVSEIRLSK